MKLLLVLRSCVWHKIQIIIKSGCVYFREFHLPVIQELDVVLLVLRNSEQVQNKKVLLIIFILEEQYLNVFSQIKLFLGRVSTVLSALPIKNVRP